MCCIFSCCLWTLDLIQRVLTFLLACILTGMVVLILTVGIAVGISYGYNYSMAEFISFSKADDVTVFMRRGQFSETAIKENDKSPLLAQRRRFGGVFPEGSAVAINKPTPVVAGDAPELANSWAQAKEAQKYDSILSKFTAWRIKPQRTTRSPVPHGLVMGYHKALLFDGENQDKVNYRTDSVKLETVTTKVTKNFPSTERRKIENFKPVYIGEDIQEKYNSQKEINKSKLVTSITTKIWSFTAFNNFITNSSEEKPQDKLNYYNGPSKSKEVTIETTTEEKVPDIKIRVSNIDFDIPEEEKNWETQQNTDKTEDYNETEEEDRIVKAIKEEANKLYTDKSKQFHGKRIPKVIFKTTGKARLKTYTEQYKSRIPDIKIRVDSNDYYKSDKNIVKTIIKPQEEENLEDIFNKNAFNERFQNVNRHKLNEGAKFDPYKMQQPPNLDRDENNDLMYRPG